MFIRNAWYFLGFSNEIGSGLQERGMLGESLVVFRDSRGRPVALDNRCPHRMAPLSMGRLTDDRIQCGYHGIQFDCSGRCVHIPGQERIPAQAGIRAYPLREQWGCAWIWMGEASRAEGEPLNADFRYLAEPGWTPVSGVKEVAAPYELIIDNLMDLTHIPFLHPNTLGNQGSAAAATAEAETRVDGVKVSVTRSVLDSEPAPLFTRVKKLEGRIDRHQYSCFVPPCYVLIELQVMPAGTRDLERGLEWRVYHIVTPIDANRTRYHWAVTRSFALDDERASAALHDGTDATLEEDKVMIEGQARMLAGRSLEARTLYTKFDSTPARVRRIIATLIADEGEAERQGTSGIAAEARSAA